MRKIQKQNVNLRSHKIYSNGLAFKIRCHAFTFVNFFFLLL